MEAERGSAGRRPRARLVGYVTATAVAVAGIALLDLALAAGGRPAAGTPAAVVPAAPAPIDPDRVLEDVRRLSGDVPLCVDGSCITVTNRLTGSTDLAQAMAYAVAAVREAGYETSWHDWTRGAWSDRNLIARRTGVVSPTDEVYVVAHVDGVSSCPDGRCPGADDNASGTAAVLEVARAFAHVPTERTVVFLLSTGEEQGSLGVKELVAGMSAAELGRIVALVNLDMVGYDGDGDRVMELYHEEHAPSLALAETMSETIRGAGLNLVPRLNPGCG